jgi:uncharacterized protein
MILPDVNILVYAHREDAPGHHMFYEWFRAILESDPAFAMAELILSGFLRVVTHPRIFNPPSTLGQAFAFITEIQNQPKCVRIQPGPRHWGIFVQSCKAANARGNLIPDAYLAALAIESGCEWVTTDRDYSRFPQLHWRHPFE